MIKKDFYLIALPASIGICQKCAATALAELMKHEVNPAARQANVKAPQIEVW